MVEERVAAVLRRLDHDRVLLAAEGERVRAGDAVLEQQLDRRGDGLRVGVGVRAERLALVWRGLGDSRDPGGRPAVEHGGVLGDGDRMRRPRRASRGRRPGARGRGRGARRASPRSRRGARPAAAPCAEAPSRPSPGGEATFVTRPRFVAECSQPCGPEKSTIFRAARAASSRVRASSSISSQPESEIGACERRRWFIASLPACRRCRASRRRSLLGAEPPSSPEAASASSPCSTMSPVLEQDRRWAISRHRGVRRSRNSRSMLKCLNSSPCASRMIASASGSVSTARRCSYQPIASASSVSDAHRRANVRVVGGQLLRRLVILVESHRFPLRSVVWSQLRLQYRGRAARE